MSAAVGKKSRRLVAYRKARRRYRKAWVEFEASGYAVGPALACDRAQDEEGGAYLALTSAERTIVDQEEEP